MDCLQPVSARGLVRAVEHYTFKFLHNYTPIQINLSMIQKKGSHFLVGKGPRLRWRKVDKLGKTSTNLVDQDLSRKSTMSVDIHTECGHPIPKIILDV